MDEYSDHRAIGSLIGKYGACPPCAGDDFPEPHMDHQLPPQPREIHVGSLKIGRQKGPVRITVLGKTYGQPRSLAGMQLTHINEIPIADIDWRTGFAKDERQEPLPPPFTADELRQQLLSPWTGLNIALALVLACLVAALMLDAADRAGWL